MTRFYRKTLTLDDGTEIPLRQIGKGMFSKAYVTESGKPTVYLITREEGAGDYSKRVLADINEETRSTYLPRVVDIGCLGDGSCVYRMPLYEAPLRKAGHPKAWAQYRVLKRCWDDASERVMADMRKRFGYWDAARQYRYRGHQIMNEVIDCARDERVSPALINALELLRDGSADYGADYSFEFSPRNLATSGRDQLILLDTVFSMESVAKARR
jgi:hypothetical protein